MPRHLRLRIALVLVVVAVSVWYLYPLEERDQPRARSAGRNPSHAGRRGRAARRQPDRSRGRGPQGGARAQGHPRQADRARREPPRSRSSWRTRSPGTTPGPSSAEFAAFERRDDDQAAGRFRLVMSERRVSQLRDDAVRQGLETIRNRVDQFGVARAQHHASGRRPDPDPAAGRAGSRARQGPHRQDGAARVQAARRADAGRTGAGRPAAGGLRDPLRARGGQADQGRAEDPVRGPEADPAHGRRADARRGLGRPELDGQLAGGDRVHVDRHADLRRGHRAQRRPAAGDHPGRHRVLGAAHQRAHPRRAAP